MNFKKIATITMAALLAISSSMPASAVTKTGGISCTRRTNHLCIFDSWATDAKGRQCLRSKNDQL